MRGELDVVRVWLLGGFRVSVGNRSVEDRAWRLKKAASLVKLLALSPNHRLHREQAMDLLWPEQGRRAAANNLRGALHAARKVIDPAMGPRYLVSEDESIVLRPGGDLWVDVDAFEEAARTARRSREPTAYEAALDLYSGELLPADRYEEWAEEHRRRLRETHLSLLLGLARLHEERADYGSAADALKRVATEEPAREEVHANLMRVYALMGNKGEALAQYGRLEEFFLRELGTEPPAYSRALREEISAGRFPPSQQPLAASAAKVPPDPGKHNLPAARTSFVGREREMVELKRTLAMTRLLTLTGAGGSGKTRLALEVSRDLVGIYPDGAWLVELAPLSEGDLVAQEVAGALKIAERPGQPLADTLAEALADKEVLLIMDNCEHLVGAAARLVDALLAACPRIQVLATSRELLGVSGEVNWAVTTLSLPAVTDGNYLKGSTIESLMGYEAVRLFVDRARQRLPDFELTQENSQAVVRVCRKLDGMPLAIELATARMGTLAVEQVAQRLEVSLDVLKGSDRTAAPRQQTLRATMDWSHDLLSEDERAFFGRLSVFVGGWTLEAAEAVCSGGQIEQDDVLDLLGGLVDKSLFVAVANADGAMRYRMLDPIRQYARERLEGTEEENVVRRTYAEFFLALAEEELEPGVLFGGPEDATGLHRLEVEHGNMRAALSWALEGGDPGLGLRLAAALSYFWDLRGDFDEGARWLQVALAKGGITVPSARADALSGLGNILRQQGDLGRAEACHEEALELYREMGEQGRVAESLALLGVVAEHRGDSARAAYFLEESMKAARGSGNLKIIPSNLNSLANIALEDGDFERAARLRKEVLTSIREQGSSLGNSGLLLAVGYTELAVGDRERATALLEESLVLSRELGDKWVEAVCLSSLGIAATLRGNPERAEALLKEGLAMVVEIGSKVDIAEGLEGLAEAAGALGKYQRTARLWGAAFALREAIGIPWWAAERVLHEPLLIAARSRLEEVPWQSAFKEGQPMTLEEVIRYALSNEEASDLHTTPVLEGPSANPPSAELTRREREVASLVAQGLTNGQIASELFISERTVDHHVEKILKKLELSSRDQVASRLAE